MMGSKLNVRRAVAHVVFYYFTLTNACLYKRMSLAQNTGRVACRVGAEKEISLIFLV